MAAFNLSLPKLQIAINNAWRDPIRNTQFIAKVDSLRGQLQRQTITLGPQITGSGRNAKQITQTIFWPEVCSTSTSSCSDECTTASGEATDNSQDVTLSCLREAGFTESFKRFRVSPLDWEEVVAYQLLLKMKALDEYLNTAYIAFLEANKGEHEYELSVGSDNAGDWEIPSADWNAELILEFMLAAEMAEFSNPYILDGTNFWTLKAQGGLFQQNLDGKGIANLFNDPFMWVQDPRGLNAAAPGKTYMVNPSAVAFVSGNFWATKPENFAGTHRMYKIASRNLPGVWYDIHELESCTSNDFVTSWKIRVNGAFLLNPLNCEKENRTGILAFEKV